MTPERDETKKFTLKELEAQVPRIKHLIDVHVEFLLLSIFAKEPFNVKLHEYSQRLEEVRHEECKLTADCLRARNGFSDGVMERSGGLDDPNKVEEECVRGAADAFVCIAMLELHRNKVNELLLEIVKYVCENHIPDAEKFLLSVRSLVKSDNSDKTEIRNGNDEMRTKCCDMILQHLKKMGFCAENLECMVCPVPIDRIVDLAKKVIAALEEDISVHPRNLPEEDEYGMRLLWCFLAGVRIVSVFKDEPSILKNGDFLSIVTEHGGIFAMDEYILPKYCGYPYVDQPSPEGCLFEIGIRAAFKYIWCDSHNAWRDEELYEASCLAGVYSELARPSDWKWIPPSYCITMVREFRDKMAIAK